MASIFDAIFDGSSDSDIGYKNPFEGLFEPKPVKAMKTLAPVPTAVSSSSSDPLVATLQRAGFKGEALKTAWAIAKRESGGRAEAYNPDRSTGDDSYGLFQINMLGNLGPSRRASYGLKSNQDLLNPDTNARVAYAMSKGGKDFGAWGIGPNAYRKMPALDFTGFPGAQAVVKSVVQKVAKAPKKTASLMALDSDSIFAPIFAGKAGGGYAPVTAVVQGENIGAKAVRQAATQLGKPYVFGSGPDTSSFDCSDLVQWSYKQLGISIPRDTWGQQKALPLKSWAELQPGDPIYRRSGGHVVIYAGGGRVIAAPHTGTVVQYQPLSNFPTDKWEVRAIR